VSNEIREYPPHGTRSRYRNVGCRCVACTRGPHGIDIPETLTWPYRWLQRKAGEDYVKAWFSEEQIEHWRLNGLGDFEADEVCIKLGLMPYAVFPGYLEAGTDNEYYP